MSLCIPADEITQRVCAPHRIVGDPGTREMFAFPKYAYIFVMKQESDNSWSVWKREERLLEEHEWEMTHYRGELNNPGDSVYRYKNNLSFLLRSDAPVGHVYAICSNVRLTFNTPFASVSTMSELMDLKFNTTPDSIQMELKNIYSTPYNYIKDGDYYCSFDCSSGRSSQVDMLLYHVAAKVDLKWNVVDSVRINKTDPAEGVRLTYMEARRLFNGYAYCFKPMKNMLSAMPGSGEGYDIEDIVIPTAEGLWWEGRSYFYTIPYFVSGDADYFPLQMLLGTNGTKESAGYQLTLKQPMDTSAVFVPWLRGDFKLSQPLGTQTVTKTIER